MGYSGQGYSKGIPISLNADGSGWLANNNFSWDENGAMTIQTLEDSTSNRNRITVTEDGLHF